VAIRTFPFASGIRRDVDIRLLPDGLLHDAVNVELDRLGRMVVRPGYTAVAQTVYGAGTLVAYDLFTLNDRLFCFGDAHSYGFPCDIYELLPAGSAARWRPSSNNNANSPRLPRATKVREIARPPDQANGVSNWGCAALGGYACLVWNPVGGLGHVHVVRAEDDQTLICERMATGDQPRLLLRAVAISDRFLILGTPQAGTALDLARFVPASDEAVTDVAQDLFSGGAITRYAACRCAGSDDFVVIAQVGADVIVRRFNSSGAQQEEYFNSALTATSVAIEASATANQVVIGYVVGGVDFFEAFNLTTGASLATRSPFTSSGTVVNVGLARVSSSQVMLCASLTGGSDPEPFVSKGRWTPATDTLGGFDSMLDAKMVSTPIFDVETMFASQYGDSGVGGTPNLILSIGDDNGDVTPQLCKDFEVADVTSALPPEIVLDSSTSKYYWANATANPDGTTIPQLTEFELSSTDRRQVAVLGNLAYIAGGVSLVFDGLTVCESGFLVRPRIISITPSNGDGELLNDAEYDYRLHWESIDSQNNLHLSPPSAISTVTMGASDDTNAIVGSTPHSMRNNNGTTALGGAVSLVATRTLATLLEAPAVIQGTKPADPPTGAPFGTLDGEGLALFISDSSGSDIIVVSFTSADDASLAAVINTINTATSGRIIASDFSGLLRLTSVESGATVSMNSGLSGIAVQVFGLPITTVFGTTATTKGQNFQRAVIDYTSIGVGSGAYVTLTDERKDQSDPIVDTDLIRQQPLYSTGVASGAHHAPPPSEYIWPGRERLVLNHPRRARFTVSKLVVPSEPAEFAAEGFVAFSGQVTGDIHGIVVLGDSILEWTRKEIWEVTGSGPGRNGVGEFFAARRVSNAGGLVDDGWTSLVETDHGVFFQRHRTQLCMMSKSGEVNWIGAAVEDYLDLYPDITAAVYIPEKHSVAFSVRSEDGTDGGILRFDLEENAWFFDDVGAVNALAEFDGRLAYVQDGIVYLQNEARGTGAAITYSFKTNLFQGFQTIGFGQLNRVGGLFTYQGPCTINLYLSTDGVDYSGQIESWALTDSEYSAGDRIPLLKDPPDQMLDTFGLMYEVIPESDSEGVWIHAVAVDVDGSPELVRKGPAYNR